MNFSRVKSRGHARAIKHQTRTDSDCAHLVLLNLHASQPALGCHGIQLMAIAGAPVSEDDSALLQVQSLGAPRRCSKRTRGLLLSVVAMAGFSPDALLVRLMSRARTAPAGETDLAAACVISAWKALILGCLNLLAARFDRSQLWPGLSAGGKHVMLASFFQALQQMGFTLAYVLTDPATALLLTSLNPLWAALLGWHVLSDALPCRTLVALAGAVIAILVVFLPPLLTPADAQLSSSDLKADATGGYTWESLAGDATAALTGLSLASYIIVVRHAADACPNASMGGAAGFGALLASIVSFAVAGAAGGGLVDGLSLPFAGFALLDATGLALGYVMLSFAPRLVTGAEVALTLQIQVLLAPVLVFIGVGVAPSRWTVVGGCLLLAVLGTHEVIATRQWMRENEREADGGGGTSSCSGALGAVASPTTSPVAVHVQGAEAQGRAA